MFQDILSAISCGIVLAFTVGPVFFVLIETSILKGFRAALAFDLGVILGDIFFILVAYFATNNLLEQIKDDPRLFISGGIILLIYGVFSYIFQRNRAKKEEIPRELLPCSTIKKSDYIGLCIKGFLLNSINIGVLGVWLGVIIIAVPRLQFDEMRILIYFIIIILAYLLVDIIKIVIAKKLRNKLTPENIFKMKQIINIFIIIFGLFLTLQGIFPNAKKQLLLYLNI